MRKFTTKKALQKHIFENISSVHMSQAKNTQNSKAGIGSWCSNKFVWIPFIHPNRIYVLYIDEILPVNVLVLD